MAYDNLPPGAGVGSLLLGGTPPGMTPPFAPPTEAPVQAPVAAPAEAPAGNPVVGAWKNFITQLQTDPNMRKALFQTGVGLMKTPELGKSGWDTASEALNRGMMTLETLREQQRRQKLEEREEVRKDETLEDVKKRTGIYGKATDAQVGEAAQRTRAAEFLNSPEVQDIKLKLMRGEIDEQEAGVQLKKAQAGYYNRMPKESAGGGDFGSFGGIGGNGGFDVQAARARFAELKRRFPEMPDAEAANIAFSAQTDLRRAKPLAERETDYVKEGVDALGFDYMDMSPQDKAATRAQLKKDFRELVKTEQEQNRSSQTGTIYPGTVAESSHIGRTISATEGGKLVNGQVIGQSANGVVVKTPSGTRTIPLEQFEAAYGKSPGK
jgi:hypothetical protein